MTEASEDSERKIEKKSQCVQDHLGGCHNVSKEILGRIGVQPEP